MTWRCHVCGEERPDAAISVWTTDKSSSYGFPAGTFMENVRYCNDRASCIDGARTFTFLRADAPRPEPVEEPARGLWARVRSAFGWDVV